MRPNTIPVISTYYWKDGAEYWKDRAERAERLCLLGSYEDRVRQEAAEGLGCAVDLQATLSARQEIHRAFSMLMDRLRETEHENFLRMRGSTLQEQYGALIAGFEDVLAEMGESVNTEEQSVR